MAIGAAARNPPACGDDDVRSQLKATVAFDEHVRETVAELLRSRHHARIRVRRPPRAHGPRCSPRAAKANAERRARGHSRELRLRLVINGDA